jgi:hypothetical protein
MQVPTAAAEQTMNTSQEQAPNTSTSQEQAPKKKPYHSPRLVVYGTIRDITKTGGNPSPQLDQPAGNHKTH